MELKQGVPVIIQLKTTVDQKGQKQNYLFDLKGQFVRIGETLYLRYKEQQPDSEELVPVTIKIEPDGKVQLIRSGQMRMRLKFSYQEKNETIMQTPYGFVRFCTFTHDLKVSLKDQPFSGSMDIQYELQAGEEKMGDYHLQIAFTA